MDRIYVLRDLCERMFGVILLLTVITTVMCAAKASRMRLCGSAQAVMDEGFSSFAFLLPFRFLGGLILKRNGFNASTLIKSCIAAWN